VRPQLKSLRKIKEINEAARQQGIVKTATAAAREWAKAMESVYDGKSKPVNDGKFKSVNDGKFKSVNDGNSKSVNDGNSKPANGGKSKSAYGGPRDDAIGTADTLDSESERTPFGSGGSSEEDDLSLNSSRSEDADSLGIRARLRQEKAARKSDKSMYKRVPATVAMLAEPMVTWGNDEALSAERLQTALTHVQKLAASNFALPPLAAIIPEGCSDQIELKLMSKIGADAAAEWQTIYQDRQIELLELLISLLPKGGVKKDMTQLLTEVELPNTPDDASCALAHAHGMRRVLNEMLNPNVRLKDIDEKIGTTVLAGIKSRLKNSDVAFHNTVGQMIFVERAHGPAPSTVWDFCAKEVKVCTEIATSLHITGRIYPETFHLLKQGGGNESGQLASSQGNSNGKRRFELRSVSEQRSFSSEANSGTLGENVDRVLCPVCGGTNCSERHCHLWKHPHANHNRSIPWSESKWGDIYLNKVPRKTSYLPKHCIAVVQQDGTYETEKWDGSTSASRADKKFKVSYAYHFYNGRIIKPSYLCQRQR